MGNKDMSEQMAPNRVPTVREWRFRFAVAPANSFGGHGKAIRSDWLTGDFGTGEQPKEWDLSGTVPIGYAVT